MRTVFSYCFSVGVCLIFAAFIVGGLHYLSQGAEVLAVEEYVNPLSEEKGLFVEGGGVMSIGWDRECQPETVTVGDVFADLNYDWGEGECGYLSRWIGDWEKLCMGLRSDGVVVWRRIKCLKKGGAE
ncbi:hypothetical protein LCGC14_0384250 [marine sediment metagenome]|uniref:Uncharacterized protein n=1 Tax=marine sediment metagenome TaxID=412755 RepID=A0A0F9VNJ3_9ZZZZ